MNKVDQFGRQPGGLSLGPEEWSPQDTARSGPARVVCIHCRARVLTRNSGAMWGHRLADDSMCPGSNTWECEALEPASDGT